jgi:CDP-paratose 2-epimerase
MKLLITGICGFAGSELARSWLEQEPGVTVYGVDNFSRPGSEINRVRLQKLGVRLFHGDIRMASDFESMPAVDYVIDAAASPSVLAGIDGRTASRQLVEHNLSGTINLLEYCKRHGAGFILMSTSRVYSVAPLAQLPVTVVGNAFCPAADQDLPSGLSLSGVSELFSTTPPVSLYGSTKLASEIMALEYGEAFGFPVWINRCGVLAGGGQFGRADQGIFSYWINAWLRRQPLAYTGFGGSGYQVRDCLHPRDLVGLLRKQTAGGAGGRDRVINLGGGSANAVSLAVVSAWCAERFGVHQVAMGPGERRFDVPWLVMDSTRAREVWGWQPETTLHEIMEEIALHAEQNPGWLELSGLL